MTLSIIAVAAFITTLLGGMLTLKFKDRLHIIIGFSAGAILAVVFFELLPEALEMAGEVYEMSTTLAFTLIGFAVYLLFDRSVLLHSHSEHEENRLRGAAGAASLSLHSFIDGAGIGLAFQVSTTAGIAVTIAVLAHKFADGINTVNMILRNKGNNRRAMYWLLVASLAPVFGIVSTLFFTITDELLGLLLSIFAGLFLYIGASDLIPESYHHHSKKWTTFSTLFGIGLLYLIINIAHI